MRKAAKLVIIDNDDKYLLMYRSDHPAFGTDPDLPGGTLEVGEQPVETMVREVYEEAGIVIDANKTKRVYAGTEYSGGRMEYSLYVAHLDYRPEVTMSWEHSAYEWLERDVFLAKARGANDTYMHMVYDTLEQHPIQ